MSLSYLSVCSGKRGCPNCNGHKTARLIRPSDTDRYVSIGNAMTVNVVRAIGYKIEEDYLRERGEGNV